jgi:hypothetical protein
MLKMIEQLSIGTTDLAGIAQLTIGAQPPSSLCTALSACPLP